MCSNALLGIASACTSYLTGLLVRASLPVRNLHPQPVTSTLQVHAVAVHVPTPGGDD